MNLIKTIEKGLLGVIALLTIVATVQEIASIYMVGRVNLSLIHISEPTRPY